MNNFDKKLNVNLPSIKEAFIEIFFNCKFLNLNYCILKNIECKNTEFLSNILIFDYKNNEYNENWFFHYFIPTDCFNKNYLLICYNNNINIEIINQIKPSKIFYNLDDILNILCNDINWNYENLNNHSFKWRDQQLISEYLDLVSEGFLYSIPLHWNVVLYKNKFNLNLSEKTLWYYNIYLNKNNLKNTLENKIYFLKNYNLNI